MINKRTTIVSLIVIFIVAIGLIGIALMPRSPSFNPLSIFAIDGEVRSSESNSFLLADNMTIGSNTVIIEYGDVSYTNQSDTLGYGFIVEWKDNIDTIWITVELRFPVPNDINISQYAANVTFYVDTFYNNTFDWQFEVMSTPKEETQTTLPSYWKQGSSNGNKTIVVNSLVQENNKFAIAIIDDEIYASFSMIIDPQIDDFSKVLITFAMIDIWKI